MGGHLVSFKNLDFANSSLKTCKNRYQTFLFLCSFTGLLHFVPNILSGIVGPLPDIGLPVLKNVIKPLAESILTPLGLTKAACAADPRIHRKI